MTDRRRAYDAWKIEREHGDEQDRKQAWNRYVVMRRRVAALIKKERRRAEEKVYEEMETMQDIAARDYWKIVNRLRGKKKGGVPDRVQTVDGKMTTDDEGTLDAFKTQLEGLGKLDIKDSKFCPSILHGEESERGSGEDREWAAAAASGYRWQLPSHRYSR
jgi:hypothetical protein